MGGEVAKRWSEYDEAVLRLLMVESPRGSKELNEVLGWPIDRLRLVLSRLTRSGRVIRKANWPAGNFPGRKRYVWKYSVRTEEV